VAEKLTHKELADLQELGFDVELLIYRGNISLPELAEHMASQAGLRVRWAAKAEHSLYLLNVIEDKYDLWQDKKKLKTMKKLELGGTRATEARVKAESTTKYPSRVKKFRQKITRLKYESQLLKSLVKSIDVKGDLLQSLRNILQDPYLREQIVQGKVKIRMGGKKHGNKKKKYDE